MFNFIHQIFIDKTFGAKRSDDWPSFRKRNIHEKCDICGKGLFLELHHIKPYHKFPELELRLENIVTLCRRHHLEWGHYFSWSSWNDRILDDIKRIKMRP